jgi:flagellar motor protein MotB
MTKEKRQVGDTDPPDGDGATLLHTTLSHIMLSKAAILAREGRYAAAESMINDLVSGEAAITPALDLMARIRAQQGRLFEATDFWKRALEAAPENDAYRAGLRRIERILNRPMWAGTILPFAAAVLALATIWFVGIVCRNQVEGLRAAFLNVAAETVRTASQTFPKPDPPPTQQDVATIPEIPKTHASDTPTVQTAVPLRQIALDVPGATVRTQETALVVQFNEGLFRSAANLTPEAEDTLSVLAQQIKPHASQVTVLVIGCTDASPVPEGWIFPDNVALGTARAVAVVDFLRGREGFPPTMFMVQSAGAEGAPYPNDTPENMLRNRTAIIRILQRAYMQGAAP